MSMGGISSGLNVARTMEVPSSTSLAPKRPSDSLAQPQVQSNPGAFGKSKDLTSQLTDNNRVLNTILSKPVSTDNAKIMSDVMPSLSKEVSVGKEKSFSASTEVSAQKGELSGSASAKINGELAGKLSASVGIDSEGLKAKAYAGSVGKVEANAKCTSSVCGIEVGSAEAKGSAKGGIETKAKGHIDSNGIGGSIGGFAGVKIKGSIGGELGPVEAKAKGELIAGIAGKLKGDISMEDGKLDVNFSMKAALGVGFGTSIHIGIDFNKLNPM
ncbi:MAG: hypothetical protein ACK4IX_07230, partial [Candidatus Sericytochromatia bacterium]